MRLHIVDGQFSTQPHRVCMFDDEREEIVRIVNAHDDGAFCDESEAEELRDANQRLNDLHDHECEQHEATKEKLGQANQEIARLANEIAALRPSAAE